VPGVLVEVFSRGRAAVLAVRVLPWLRGGRVRSALRKLTPHVQILGFRDLD